MTKLIEIMGIDRNAATKLHQLGIDSAEMLLMKCRLHQDRLELSQQLLISRRRLLNWAQQAELLRVSGIGCEYADLLCKVNVKTVDALAQSMPLQLREQLAQANKRHRSVKRVPAVSRVETWISQAQGLHSTIEH